MQTSCVQDGEWVCADTIQEDLAQKVEYVQN